MKPVISMGRIVCGVVIVGAALMFLRPVGAQTSRPVAGATTSVARSQFANLQDALNATVEKTLWIDVDTPISTPHTVPANTLLKFTNGAKIINNGGSMNFLGEGFVSETPQRVCFSNFTPGSIRFTGAIYPVSLTAQNFGARSLSESLKVADAALLNKPAELVAYAGTFDSRFDLTQYHTLRLGEGEFRNTFDGGTNLDPAVVVHDNTKVVGAGMTKTIFYESETSTVSNIIYASSVLNPNPNGKNHNIEISDIEFRNANYKRINQAYSAVSVGNATNGHIRRCFFYGLRGFGAYIGGTAGGTGAKGNRAEDSSLVDCVFQYSAQNSAGVLNGQNILIARNIFSHFGGYTMRRLDGITTANSRTLKIAGTKPIKIDGATTTGGFRSDMTAATGPFGPNFVILTYPDGSKSELIPINSMQSETEVTLGGDAALPVTATGVKVDVVVGSTLAIDCEPNQGDDVIDRVQILDNIFDVRDAQASAVFGVKMQSAAARTGVRNSIISRNTIIGDDNSIGRKNIKLVNGFEIINADNIVISDNAVQGSSNAGYIVENGYNITLRNNTVSLAGTADDKAIVLTAVADSDITGNIIRRTYSTGWAQSERIFEQELGLPISIDADGVTVRRLVGGAGYIFLDWWTGKQVTINDATYTVASVTDQGTLTLTTKAAPTKSGAMSTRFSNNTYFANKAATIRLVAGGQSVNYGYGDKGTNAPASPTTAAR